MNTVVGIRLKRIRLLSVSFFFSSRRRHTRFDCDWSSDVCSSDLGHPRRPSPPRPPERSGWPSADRARTTTTTKWASRVRRYSPTSTLRRSPTSSWRSEERRGGEEGRSRGSPYHLKKKKA